MTCPRCTAIVLTLNESENLERCFASLRWCREIVVVDSGSTDDTGERATSLGARFLVHRQTGPFNFAEQRNWALRAAGIQEGHWVIFLDADEVMPEPLAEQLTQIAEAEEAGLDAYELTPRYLFWGTWLKRTQGYPNWHPRFVRVGAAFYAGGVWEHFAPGTRVGRLDQPYDHHANSKGFADWLARHHRYSSWDAERIFAFQTGGDPAALGTTRKLRLRRLAARLWPVRPLARFFLMYVLRGGFLEGRAALAFCLLYAFYEYMIVIKVVELRRRARQLPL